MGLEGFLERYGDERKSLSDRNVENGRLVNLHRSGLLLPDECDLLPSQHSTLPHLVITKQINKATEPSENRRDERTASRSSSSREQMRNEIVPIPPRRGSESSSRSLKSHIEESGGARGEAREREQERDGRDIKSKGTSWQIEFDPTPPVVDTKPQVHMGGEFKSREEDQANVRGRSPLYSREPPSFILDQTLPPPPITQAKDNILLSGNSDQSRKETERTLRHQRSDEHSIGSNATTNPDRRENSKISSSGNTGIGSSDRRHHPPAQFSRWGQLPQHQCTMITPICIHRDSAPLRCLSLLSVPASHPPHDHLEDSLGLAQDSNHAPNSLIAVGSNSKSIVLLSYDYSAGGGGGGSVSSGGGGGGRGKVTIVDELPNVHNGSVYAVDWSSDGRYLASGSNDKSIRIIS
jgi:hypothetical protein